MTEKDMMKFLKDNGHVLIHMAEEDTLIKSLCKIMSDKELRLRVANFYQMDNLADIHFQYFLLNDDKKVEVLNVIKEKLIIKN